MAIAKVAGLLGAVTAIAVPALVVSTSKVPVVVVYKTVASESNKSEYTGKYGDYFKHHLISSKDESNKSWWDEAFARLTKDKTKNGQDATDISTEFKAATEADGSKSTSLKQICFTAYKKTHTELTANNTPHYLKDLWTYCSLEKAKPETISTTTVAVAAAGAGTSQKIKEKYGDKLVKADDNKNNEFWRIQEETFFGESGIGSGSIENSDFKTLHKNSNSDRLTVRATCKAVYEKDATNTANETDVFKFCSLSGVKPEQAQD